ncbi:MAG: T9SS type A sorting domain-containing protein [Flavobacteriia bacterium]|jgi:hypothetical protein
MRKNLLKIGLIAIISVLSSFSTFAQNLCTNNAGPLSPAITNTWNTLVTTGGYYQFDATAGCDYTFSFCQNGGSFSGDPYITITDLGNAIQVTSDDFCGLGSELTWTCPTTGTYLLHMTNFGAGTANCSFTARTLAYFSTCSACPGVPPVAPTLTGTASLCGPGQVTLNGNQNGAVNCETYWYQTGQGSPFATTVTPTATQTVTVSATTTYLLINHDLATGCNSSATTFTVSVNPLPFVNIGNLDTIYCVSSSAVNLTLSPTGGNLTGTGVSGNTFAPTAAGVGVHSIEYSYTNAATGCSNTDIVEVTVEEPTVDPALQICNGSTIDLSGTGLNSYEWYDASVGGNLIGTGQTITVTNIQSDTVFYYQETPTTQGFGIDTLTSGSALTVDHNTITGDDHGGIAVTQNYIYYVGDGSSVRYDFPSLTNGIAVPKRDGIFSDLSTGQLYSLWNGTVDPVGTTIALGGYSFSQIITLNADLTLGTTTIPLSQTITTGGNYGGPQSGIFSGYGFMIFFNNDNNTFYHIDVTTGLVTQLGTFPFPPSGTTENWSRWGVAEYLNGLYSVVYSTAFNSNRIERLYCSSGTTESVAQFSNLGDVASIAYSPWASKWAYHTEASTDHTTGGEVIVVLDGSHILNYSADRCRKELPVNFYAPVVDAGADVTILNGTTVQLNGSGGVSCFWSPGVSLDDPQLCNPTAGPTVTTEYFVTITDANGCQGIDSVTVFVSGLGIDENSLESQVTVFPNPSKGDITIDLGTISMSNDSKIELLDAQGKLVAIFDELNSQKITIKKSLLGNGVYTLKFDMNNTIFMKRIVLQD